MTSSWALFKTSFRISDICKLIHTNTDMFLISYYLHSELVVLFCFVLFFAEDSSFLENPEDNIVQRWKAKAAERSKSDTDK